MRFRHELLTNAWRSCEVNHSPARRACFNRAWSRIDRPPWPHLLDPLSIIQHKHSRTSDDESTKEKTASALGDLRLGACAFDDDRLSMLRAMGVQQLSFGGESKSIELG